MELVAHQPERSLDDPVDIHLALGLVVRAREGLQILDDAPDAPSALEGLLDGIAQLIALHELLFQMRPLLRRIGVGDPDLVQASVEAGEVSIIVHEAAVHNGGHLIDPVCEEKAAIHDRK